MSIRSEKANTPTYQLNSSWSGLVLGDSVRTAIQSARGENIYMRRRGERGSAHLLRDLRVRYSGRPSAMTSVRDMGKKPLRYIHGEIGRFRVIKNFLPPPDKLVLREANVKVTLSLSQRSVDFSKR